MMEKNKGKEKIPLEIINQNLKYKTKEELINSKEFKKAPPIQRTEFLLAFHLRNILEID